MIGRLALFVTAAIGASYAFAGDNVSIAVTATVLPVCKFFSTSSQRDAPTSYAAIRYSCTNGTSPSFTVPPDARATCFACEGAVATVGSVPRFNVIARGFGTDRSQAQIAIEPVIGAAPDGTASRPGLMTIMVAP